MRARLLGFLKRQTGKGFGQDLNRWRRWVWTQPYEPHPDYATFKATLYGQIDETMGSFFPPQVPTRVRLDQVDWGGVSSDGIPALEHAAAIPA